MSPWLFNNNNVFHKQIDVVDRLKDFNLDELFADQKRTAKKSYYSIVDNEKKIYLFQYRTMDKAKKKKITIKKSAIKKLPKKEASTIQSVIFGNKWKLADAKRWLKENDHKPIGKVHITKAVGKREGGSMKFTLVNKDMFDKLGFKRTKQGISFTIGALKTVNK